MIGSFVNNWALRRVRGLSALGGRSQCEHCATPLSYIQTIPIASFLLLKGRCAHCRSAVDPLHLASELAGVVIVALGLQAPTIGEAACHIAVGFVLLALAIIDLKILRLPNVLTGATAALCTLIAILRERLLEGLIAASILVAVLLCLRAAVRRGATPGLGLGDVKLAGGLALWLGASSTWMLALAAALNIVWTLLASPKDRKLPFGPALAAAALIVAGARDLAGGSFLL